MNISCVQRCHFRDLGCNHELFESLLPLTSLPVLTSDIHEAFSSTTLLLAGYFQVPVDQQVVNHSGPKAVWQHETCWTTFKVTSINPRPHSDAYFDLQQGIFTAATRLQALSCSCLIDRLAMCITFIPHKVAGKCTTMKSSGENTQNFLRK